MDIIDYYTFFNEQDRLSDQWGQIEFIRSKEIIEQYLPRPNGIILDIGGATGRYACWLAKKGYKVHLIDPVTKHIEQAMKFSEKQPDFPISRFSVGDARNLDYDESYADAILLMGPLYHLLYKEDRLAAIKESFRVLRPNGVLFAVGISRFASSIDGLMSGYFKDPSFRKIMKQDLLDGQHRNPTDNVNYFTDSYFHHPEGLKDEVSKAGFNIIAMHAIEGISYMLQDFNKNWSNKEYQEFLLNLIRRMDKEPSIIGASPHIMAVALKN